MQHHTMAACWKFGLQFLIHSTFVLVLQLTTKET